MMIIPQCHNLSKHFCNNYLYPTSDSDFGTFHEWEEQGQHEFNGQVICLGNKFMLSKLVSYIYMTNF